MKTSCINILCLFALYLKLSVSLSNAGKEGLKIGAFNIQIFGEKKVSKKAVVNILVDIVSRYDIILIQEIRDRSGKAFEEFVKLTNDQNSEDPFSYKISPRLGRTTSKEQYAYLYRERSGLKIEMEYVYEDGDESLNTDTNNVDTFEREPYIVLIESSRTKLKKFALAGLHVSPSKAVEELQKLGDVFEDIRAKFDIGNIMIMGDFNAGCTYVPKSKWPTIPVKNNHNYTWWIGDDADTTVKTDCPYDRFVSTGNGFKNGVIKGSASTFRFDRAYSLNQTFSYSVSDHYPIELDLAYDDYFSLNGADGTEATGPTLIIVISTFVHIYVTYL